MSGDLSSLIRLHRWQIDEKRRALADLHDTEDQLLADAARLEETIKAEQRTARQQTDVAFGYASFARAAIGRRRQLAQALAEIRERIAVATDDLAESFQELKRFELAQDQRDQREAARRRHLETTELDEIAEIGFRRQGQGQDRGEG